MSEGEDSPLLWQLRFSHFNEKARWALDYKKVPHRRRSLVPGRHVERSKRLGGTGTTPILKLDGEVIGDTSEIVAKLEQHQPDPPLYPDTEIERHAVLDLEQYFGREVGPGVRTAIFHAILPYRRVAVPLTTQGLGVGVRVMFTLGYPGIRRAVRRAMDADDDGARRGREATVRGLERVEDELGGREYLVGERFSVADLTAAALLCPLVAPPEFAYDWPPAWPDEWEEFRRSLADRPGYQWVQEMYRRHRGSSAAISDD
ncbi:MAG TPA: glutathione S-transferase family protein [Candidatus Dormibacteraeota bacterium]|jgi:glutathione S-transferase